MKEMIWVDGTSIKRGDEYYAIDFVDLSSRIIVSKSIVEEIVREEDNYDEGDEDSYLVALLCAQIERARQNTSIPEKKKKVLERIKEGLLIDVIKTMINMISIEEIIVRLENITYYNLLTIFDSDNPVETIEELA